jgi:hypothetical protein
MMIAKDCLQVSFWIASAIEAGFAFIGLRKLNQRPGLRVLVWLVGLLTPILIQGFDGLKPVRFVSFVFLFISSLFVAFDTHHKRAGKKPGGSSETLFNPITASFEIIIPSNLPLDFEEVDRNIYSRKGYSEIEIIFENSDKNVMWLKEADGPIIDVSHRKHMQIVDKEIRGVSIQIEQKAPKPSNKSKPRQSCPFIEAIWKMRNINFNLRSDGLSLDEMIQVIDSMIKEKLW